MALTQWALAQTNQPILIGTGRDLITAETIATVSQLTKSVRGESTDIWTLNARADVEKKGKLDLVEVLYSPKNLSERVLRCRSVDCIGFPRGPCETAVKYARIGDWYLYDEPPNDYCWIVPVGQKIIEDKPVGERFEMNGAMTGADLAALFDATQRSVQNATGISFGTRDPSHAVVSVHSDACTIYFEKFGENWKETRKRKWVD